MRYALCAMAALVLAGILGTASARASHTSNNLARLGVLQPCCGGASLQGTRATIRSPTIASLPFGTGSLSSVSVEGNSNLAGGGLVQVGIKQSNSVGYHFPNCEQPSLSFWVEIFDLQGTRCYFLGAAAGTSTTHRYSIQRQSGPSINYQVFLDGVAPGGQIITGVPSTSGNVGAVGAGVEITRRTTSSDIGLLWNAQFGGNGNTLWQRYNATLGWVTINQWTNQSNGGGWAYQLGGFPSVWSVSR